MKVSIVLISWSPSNYRLNLLKQTITSLRKHTKVPFELIVVDNGLEEQTNWLKTQQIDKHIINKVNQGIGYARNQGMEVAEGDYIAFIDNDILFVKDGWLEDSVNILKQYPEEKLIIGPWFSFDENVRRKYKRIYLGEWNGYPRWQRMGPACWVAKKEIIKDIGRWSIASTPGRDCCVLLTRKGYKYIGLKEQKANHVGKRKSYRYKLKLINGVWVDRRGGYWDRIWIKNAYKDRYFRGHGRLFRTVKKYLNGKIADLGCGVTSLYIGGDYDVVGLDVSPEAVKQSKKWYPKGNFIVRNIEKTKLKSDAYDTVLLISIIEHFSDFSRVLAEAKRICKLGGKIVIAVPKKNFFEDHIHPIWDGEKIEKEIGGVLGKVSYRKIHNRWWLVIYEKT